MVAEDAPQPGVGEALVRMEACGICHSDLFVAGLEKLPLTPLTLGHEGIGRVEALGPDVTGIAIGDRVGVTFLAATCGDCQLCRSGQERYCPKQLNSGFTVDGALADHAIVRTQHLARVPETLSAAEAAPLCCAGWTAYAAVRESGLAEGAMLAVFGMGGLGHLAVQYGRARALRVVVADVSESKLEQARALGAEFAVAAETAGRTLQKQYGGVDAAVVLTASPAAIEQAFRSVKRTGTVILVGLSTSEYTLPVVDTVLKGIRIHGSYLGTRADLAAVFRLAVEAGVKPHIETYSIELAPAAIEKLRAGAVAGRAVVVF